VSGIKIPRSLDDWEVSHFVDLGLHCVTARRRSHTLIFKQLESGRWNLASLTSGKLTREITLVQTPLCVKPHISRRPRRAA
jgi:hypothetical protein